MQILKRIIELARETAQSGFYVMAQHIVAAAEEALKHPDARSSFDRSTQMGGYDFLRRDGGSLAKRLSNYYNEHLTRAMQTMYVDLRAKLMDLSADHLTLIDDETMNRQIEVDRLVQRLREADPDSLGRLNMIISQLHDEHEVRERENPFRPYLLARTLYSVLDDMCRDAPVKHLLFDQLAKAMVEALPSYYRAIRNVFEMSGVHAQLVARPSMMSSAQRNMLARQTMMNWQTVTGQVPPVPVFMPQGGGFPTLQEPQQQGNEFQDLIHQLFKLSRSGRRMYGAPAIPGTEARQAEAGPPAGGASMASGALLAKLGECQQAIAAGRPVEGQLPQEKNQLFAIRDIVDAVAGSDQEKMMVEVVGLLFEFILNDPLVPEKLREAIGRLQLPFLRAAMLEPEILQKSDHPVRRLLNRMGSLAASVEPESAEAGQLGEEIARVTGRILSGFERDSTVFAEGLKEVEDFAASRLEAAPRTEALADALNESEMLCTMTENIARSLEEVLQTLALDLRVKNFLLNVWSRVLAHAAYTELFEQDDEVNLPQLDIVPDLIWSAQPRQDQQQRAALTRFLPGLVTNIRKYLQAVPLPPGEFQRALDQLVEVHTDILRQNHPPVLQAPLTLEQLYDRFGAIKIDVASWDAALPAPVNRAVVESVLAKRGVEARIFVEEDALPLFASDDEFLAHLQPGTAAEFALDAYAGQARLFAASRKSSLFAFQPRDGSPLVFSSISLIKAFRQSKFKPSETLPLFERAIESLLNEAESA